MLNRFPTLRRALRAIRDRLLPGSMVSLGYVPLDSHDAEAEGRRLRNSWQDENLPSRQRRLVDQQLSQYRAGARIDAFDVFVQAIRELRHPTPSVSLLEIGCSSGYYSEVSVIANLPVVYSGCDYSHAFIRLARERYPDLVFSVEDATALRHPDDSFDIVVSGCCLLHIPDYGAAIVETARVARRFAIFHRTPVVWGQPEQWYRKKAYGVETVEIHFNEPGFLNLLQRAGLDLLATHTLYEECSDTNGGRGQAMRTYVCAKQDKSVTTPAH